MQLFDPAVPDGTNQSLDLAISLDGLPVLDKTYTLAARCGMAVKMSAGQYLTISNPTGHQVCDFWAFSNPDLSEYLSMEHLRTSLGSIFPKVGDGLASNLRRDLLSIVSDSSPGIHDTLIASCDHARYQQLGCDEYHDNCADNLRMALMAIGLKAPAIPAPFNLWMNVPVSDLGATQFAPPLSNAGDVLVLRANYDVIAVMSACPQDVTPVNGAGRASAELKFSVSDSDHPEPV
jgi:uncharacterized protein YcgI (DUF1989 family)